jgi:hypothetical protein
MRIVASTPREAAILERRFRAVAHLFGPSVTLEATLPCGAVLRPPGGATAADQVAGLTATALQASGAVQSLRKVR